MADLPTAAGVRRLTNRILADVDALVVERDQARAELAALREAWDSMCLDMEVRVEADDVDGLADIIREGRHRAVLTPEADRYVED